MLDMVIIERGWLKKQLNAAEQEILSWPEWKRIDIDAQYQELCKHIEETNYDRLYNATHISDDL